MTEFHRRDDWLLVIGNVKSFEEFQAKMYITHSTAKSNEHQKDMGKTFTA